jgi:hypothetical protein
MYARIQTWFPFQIQVGLNGREWLAQQMLRTGLNFQQAGNCFPWIEDYSSAERNRRCHLMRHRVNHVIHPNPNA